jgi:hypothetical protein
MPQSNGKRYDLGRAYLNKPIDFTQLALLLSQASGNCRAPQPRAA